MPSVPPIHLDRYHELKRLLVECEDLMAKQMRGVCIGTSILLAAGVAFWIAAFWGPFSFVDAFIANACVVCAVLVERKSRADWWRDQRDLAEVAEKIKAEMRAITRGNVNRPPAGR